MARALASAWRRNYSTTRDTKKRRYGPPMINLQPNALLLAGGVLNSKLTIPVFHVTESSYGEYVKKF
jgi:hypothetical protein